MPSFRYDLFLCFIPGHLFSTDASDTATSNPGMGARLHCPATQPASLQHEVGVVAL